ncbi:MAG: DNA/RNA non-specific endonuclease, partial [Marinirhabdus sp.]
TFLTSNISPQEKKFNAGIWNRLEQKTRDWAQKKNGVYVVTGGILNGKTRTIGYENVTVPGAFYKIVLDKAGGGYDAIAFIIPNRASDASFYDHTVTIDEIEAQTGIDFFNKLPDSTETALEAKMAGKGWRGR